MRKRTSTVIVILMIVAGLSLLLYPTVSNYLKSLSYRRTIANYVTSVEPMDDGRHEELLEAAQAYNERLSERNEFMLLPSKEQQTEYDSLLNIDGSGIMGYVSIPKINVALPVYHGTSDEVLQSGVGHLEGSSLPVGGPGTHSVLSAHTGLPSSRLFTDIDHLVEGDSFTVQVLKETLVYQVDQIQVVLPNEADALRIEPGEDYCTLLTCTPYGVNTHRLLVRGRRIVTPAQEEASSHIAEGALAPDNDRLTAGSSFLIAALIMAALLTAALLWRKRMWKRAKRLKK